MVLARRCVDLNGGLPQLGGKLTTSSTIHAKAVVFRRVGHVDSMRHIHIALLRLPAIRLVLAVYCTLFPIFFTTTFHPPSGKNNYRQSRVNMFLSSRFAHFSLSARQVSCELDCFSHFVLFSFAYYNFFC